MKTMFYNPKVAAIGIDVSIVTNSIQLSIAKTFDPNVSGRPVAGQKVYDWDNQSFFSLMPEECFNIDQVVNPLLNGTYIDPKATDPKYAHIFNLTHYKDEHATRFSLQLKNNSLVIGIKNPNNPQMCYYQFRPAELAVFLGFVRAGYQRLPYESAFRDAITKKERKDNFDKNNKGNNQQTNSRIQPVNQPANPQQNYQQSQQQQDPSRQNQPAPPQQSAPQPQTFDSNAPGGDMDSINFNF